LRKATSGIRAYGAIRVAVRSVPGLRYEPPVLPLTARLRQPKAMRTEMNAAAPCTVVEQERRWVSGSSPIISETVGLWLAASLRARDFLSDSQLQGGGFHGV
jgi:hypothetical protein